MIRKFICYFWKSIVKLKRIHFHEIFARTRKRMHPQSGKMKYLLSPKNISSNQIYNVISFLKMLLSRNFCQKRVRENFRFYHTVHIHRNVNVFTKCLRNRKKIMRRLLHLISRNLQENMHFSFANFLQNRKSSKSSEWIVH